MKHVVTGIVLKLAHPRNGSIVTIQMPIVPGSGTVTSKTSADGLTEEITVSARIIGRYPFDGDYLADARTVTVHYSDEPSGTVKTIEFGSMDVPARFTVENTTTTTMKCVYKRVL